MPRAAGVLVLLLALLALAAYSATVHESQQRYWHTHPASGQSFDDACDQATCGGR